MTRAEHIAWAKKRASEYVKRGQLQEAVSSMLSDLSKHPETECSLTVAAVLALALRPDQGEAQCRKWIEGFN